MPSVLTREFLEEVVRESGWSLSEVESLSLEGEEIRHLGRDLFRGVDKLMHLNLADNQLFSLQGVEHLSSLATGIFRANRLSSMREIQRLAMLPNLRDLDLRRNPIMARDKGDGISFGNPRELVLQVLPNLLRLDEVAVTDRERFSVATGDAARDVREDKRVATLHEKIPEARKHGCSVPNPRDQAAFNNREPSGDNMHELVERSDSRMPLRRRQQSLNSQPRAPSGGWGSKSPAYDGSIDVEAAADGLSASSKDLPMDRPVPDVGTSQTWGNCTRKSMTRDHSKGNMQADAHRTEQSNPRQGSAAPSELFMGRSRRRRRPSCRGGESCGTGEFTSTVRASYDEEKLLTILNASAEEDRRALESRLDFHHDIAPPAAPASAARVRAGGGSLLEFSEPSRAESPEGDQAPSEHGGFGVGLGGDRDGRARSPGRYAHVDHRQPNVDGDYACPAGNKTREQCGQSHSAIGDDIARIWEELGGDSLNLPGDPEARALSNHATESVAARPLRAEIIGQRDDHAGHSDMAYGVDAQAPLAVLPQRPLPFEGKMPMLVAELDDSADQNQSPRRSRYGTCSDFRGVLKRSVKDEVHESGNAEDDEERQGSMGEQPPGPANRACRDDRKAFAGDNCEGHEGENVDGNRDGTSCREERCLRRQRDGSERLPATKEHPTHGQGCGIYAGCTIAGNSAAQCVHAEGSGPGNQRTVVTCARSLGNVDGSSLPDGASQDVETPSSAPCISMSSPVSDVKAVPQISDGHAHAPNPLTRGPSPSHFTSSAERAVEAFRRSTLRLGLLDKDHRSHETGSETDEKAGTRAAVEGKRCDLGAGSLLRASKVTELSKLSLTTCYSSDDAGVTSLGTGEGSAQAAEDTRIAGSIASSSRVPLLLQKSKSGSSPAVKHSVAAIGAGSIQGAERRHFRCSACGGEQWEGTATDRSNAHSRANPELEDRWLAREREFEERWMTREKKFCERWMAREREFDQRRREDAKEFMRGVRSTLLEAHKALISANAWLVARLQAAEGSYPPQLGHVDRTKAAQGAHNEGLITTNSNRVITLPAGVQLPVLVSMEGTAARVEPSLRTKGTDSLATVQQRAESKHLALNLSTGSSGPCRGALRGGTAAGEDFVKFNNDVGGEGANFVRPSPGDATGEHPPGRNALSGQLNKQQSFLTSQLSLLSLAETVTSAVTEGTGVATFTCSPPTVAGLVKSPRDVSIPTRVTAAYEWQQRER